MPVTGAPIILPEGSAPPTDSGPSFMESVEEARTHVHTFPASDRATYVKDMVAKILTYKSVGDSTDTIRARLPEFVRDYPTLFDMVLDPKYDPQMLNVMLTMLNRMGDGSLTQHQASVIVGQRLIEKSKAAER